MVRYCVIEGCERRLRTGNKYCHVHRSEGRHSDKKNDLQEGSGGFGMILILFVFIGIIVVLEKSIEKFNTFILSNKIVV